MKNFNAEMIEKAKAAKSAKELFELAKAEGIDITEDEARKTSHKMHHFRFQ